MERTGIEPATPCLQSRNGPLTGVSGRSSLSEKLPTPLTSAGLRWWGLLQGWLQPSAAERATSCFGGVSPAQRF
jgi:hypothetical protein